MQAVNLVNDLGKPAEIQGICSCFYNIKAMCCEKESYD